MPDFPALRQNEDEYCMLLAVPAIPEGGGQAEELAQRSTLRTAFITYLQLKQAAGIINIDGPQVRHRRRVALARPSSDDWNKTVALCHSLT